MNGLVLAADTCWLLLIRHGATANNEANPPVLQGQGANDALSDLGWQQVRRCRDWLREAPLGAVYSSPLLRARQTAETLAEPHGLEPAIVAELTEADVGQWEGRDWGDIAQSDPEGYRAFMDDPGRVPYPGGESFADVQRRVLPAVLQRAEAHLGQAVAVVAHNVVHRTLVAAAMELPLQHSRRIFLENAGVSLVRFRQGRLKALTINAMDHLLDLGPH